jgi:uncharacterized protein YlxP (DUF503 family)
VHACVLSVEVHIPSSTSLKAKRSVVRHLLDTARARFHVAASEVDFHDQWQRSAIGFAAVARDATQVEEVLDAVERFVWSHPEVEVLATRRHWIDTDS